MNYKNITKITLALCMIVSSGSIFGSFASRSDNEGSFLNKNNTVTKTCTPEEYFKDTPSLINPAKNWFNSTKDNISLVDLALKEVKSQIDSRIYNDQCKKAESRAKLIKKSSLFIALGSVVAMILPKVSLKTRLIGACGFFASIFGTKYITPNPEAIKRKNIDDVQKLSLDHIITPESGTIKPLFHALKKTPTALKNINEQNNKTYEALQKIDLQQEDVFKNATQDTDDKLETAEEIKYNFVDSVINSKFSKIKENHRYVIEHLPNAKATFAELDNINTGISTELESYTKIKNQRDEADITRVFQRFRQ